MYTSEVLTQSIIWVFTIDFLLIFLNWLLWMFSKTRLQWVVHTFRSFAVHCIHFLCLPLRAVVLDFDRVCLMRTLALFNKSVGKAINVCLNESTPLQFFFLFRYRLIYKYIQRDHSAFLLYIHIELPYEWILWTTIILAVAKCKQKVF